MAPTSDASIELDVNIDGSHLHEHAAADDITMPHVAVLKKKTRPVRAATLQQIELTLTLDALEGECEGLLCTFKCANRGEPAEKVICEATTKNIAEVISVSSAFRMIYSCCMQCYHH